MLNKQELENIELAYKQAVNAGTDLSLLDRIIKEMQKGIKDDVADYAALKKSTDANQAPTTAKLTQLRSQQHSGLSEEANKLLLAEEYTATLKSLTATKEIYAAALKKSETLSQQSPTGPMMPQTGIHQHALHAKYNTQEAQNYRDILKKNIAAITSHIDRITAAENQLQQEIDSQKQQKQSWQGDVNRTLTAQAPNAKSIAKEIGEEQARAVILAATNQMRQLEKIAAINAQLETAKDESDPDKKGNAVKKALDELNKIAPPEKTIKSRQRDGNTTQNIETGPAEIIKNLEFDPQEHSGFQGGKIPPELDKLKTITEEINGIQQKIIALKKELNQPALTVDQEKKISEKISEKQKNLKSKVFELNAWLLKHEYGLLRTIQKEVANRLLKASHDLMDYVGYSEMAKRGYWQTFRGGKKYTNRPHKEIYGEYDHNAFTKKYGEVRPGAYGDIVKFDLPDTTGTTDMDVSQLVLPLYGINSSDPKAEKFSLLQVLIDTYGPVGSENFNKHAQLEKDGSITIRWRGEREKETLFKAIKTRNDEYVKWKSEQNNLEATAANSKSDVTASIGNDNNPVTASVPKTN